MKDAKIGYNMIMDTILSIPIVDVRGRIPHEMIRGIVRRIADEFHPQKIILFGSYAYGIPRPESDVDLLVIIDTPVREAQQALAIRQFINPLFSLDILVKRPSTIAQRLDWGDSFLHEVTERGIVLYESTHS
jgi:predicted nucleotidyltransferase